MVTQFWQDREAEKPGDPVPFSIHEHDRAAVREHLIEAIIHAPEPVRYDTTWNTPLDLYCHSQVKCPVNSSFEILKMLMIFASRKKDDIKFLLLSYNLNYSIESQNIKIWSLHASCNWIDFDIIMK